MHGSCTCTAGRSFRLFNVLDDFQPRGAGYRGRSVAAGGAGIRSQDHRSICQMLNHDQYNPERTDLHDFAAAGNRMTSLQVTAVWTILPAPASAMRTLRTRRTWTRMTMLDVTTAPWPRRRSRFRRRARPHAAGGAIHASTACTPRSFCSGMTSCACSTPSTLRRDVPPASACCTWMRYTVSW